MVTIGTRKIVHHLEMFLLAYVISFCITLSMMRTRYVILQQRRSLLDNLDLHRHVVMNGNNAVSMDEQLVFVSHTHDKESGKYRYYENKIQKKTKPLGLPHLKNIE